LVLHVSVCRDLEAELELKVYDHLNAFEGAGLDGRVLKKSVFVGVTIGLLRAVRAEQHGLSFFRELHELPARPHLVAAFSHNIGL